MEQIFLIIDILASEYGWSLEYCLNLPGDVVTQLVKRIQERKLREAQQWTKLIGAACAAGFSGKLDKLDSIFKSKSMPEVPDVETEAACWKSQVKGMWLQNRKKGKNLTAEEFQKLNDEFEAKWAKGENIEL
jgi:hypothetical protein